MRKGSLSDTTKTWANLFKNGSTFVIPRFQRDYRWRVEHWEDLWNDIEEMTADSQHYLGYLVLRETDKNEYTIIDGQQRLVTLSILALAVIKLISELAEGGNEAEENKERAKILTDAYLGAPKDPTSLTIKSKLTLNRNDDDFYKNHIMRFRRPAAKGNLKPSQRLLLEAYDFFYGKIKSRFEGSVTGAKLADFLDNQIAENILFTSMMVSSDEEAYKVFETLNSRGVKLSPTDLLKNYLFMVAAKSGETDIERVERQWSNINDILGKIDFTDYLRHFWNSRRKRVTKTQLFREISKEITTPAETFSLLDELEDCAQIYAAFSHPDDELWKEAEQYKYIEELQLFDVSQCYPLLLAAHPRLDVNEYARLLRCCAVISFRFLTIAGLNPNDLEAAYNKTAMKVHSGDLKDAYNIRRELDDIYTSDEKFMAAFTEKNISPKGRWGKIIKYILVQIENQGGGNYNPYDGKISIEHILPQSPTSGWERFIDPDEQDSLSTRLGNYTILEPSINRECGNKPFEKKNGLYRDSIYKMSKEIAGYEEWKRSDIIARQKWMAKQAKLIWKF